MFVGYDDNFPYSYVTDRLVRAFPSWTKVRKDPNSIGTQFLNVFGLEMQEIDSYLTEALNNQYIGAANLGEISVIYKIKVDTLDIDSATVYGYDLSATPVSKQMRECYTLFEFYSASPDDDPYIVDLQEGLLYSRNSYSKVRVVINSQPTDYTEVIPHHVWNVFDEFALLLGIRRRYLESNSSLKERIMDIFRFPGNATRLGLARAIGRELGLVYIADWQEDTSSFVIDETAQSITVIPETIIVSGYDSSATPTVRPNATRLKPDQYSYNSGTKVYTIYPRVKAFFDREFQYQYDNVRLTPDKKLVLNGGAKEGFLITPVFEPSNLKRWDKLLMTATGDITVDVVRYDFDKYTDQSQAYLVTDLTNNGDILVPGATPLNIDIPVRLIVTLKRSLRSDPSPVLEDLSITYIPCHGRVSCIHDVGLQALHDDKFRNTLFDERGTPSDLLKNYVNELNELVPIMWGRWKWDESYWDVVGKNLMGLHVLPNKWDPYLGLIINKYSQTGIGFNLDCLVKFDENSWYPKIHSGFYYLAVTETITSDGTDTLYTKYPKPHFVDVKNISMATPAYCTVIEAKKNKIKLREIPTAGDQLQVTYMAEHYLYTQPISYTISGPTSEFVLQNAAATPVNAYPMQGAPIIIEATRDGKRVMLQQMHFFDYGLESVGIINYETKTGNGTNKLGLTYDNPFDINIDGYTVTSVDENVITLDTPVPIDTLVDVSYKVQDSFVIQRITDGIRIILSGTYTNVSVSFESTDQVAYMTADNTKSTNNPIFDPLKSHITDGFLFITNEVKPINDLVAKVDPDIITGNGSDFCIIIVDAVDKDGNPVLNQSLTATVSLSTDEATPTPIVPAGTLTQTGSYYNRRIYKYVSPDEAVIPDRGDGSGRNVPCIATVTFTCGSIQEVAHIKVR